MSADDFDIESLSEYLHLDRAQVARLAERGKLPGRKVGGVWRFSRSEIHHWLEERIGISDPEELERMDDAFERQAVQQPVFTTLAELLAREAIAIPLHAKTRNSVILEMVELALRTGWLWDPARMEEAIRQREDLHPTALENGVALLHPRRPLATALERPFVAFGRTVRGVPFGGSRSGMTDLFFLVASTTDRGHLHALARLSRLLGEPDFVDQLRTAPDADCVLELVRSTEQALLE